MLSSSCLGAPVVFKSTLGRASCLRCLISMAQASRVRALLFAFSEHVDLFPPLLSCCVCLFGNICFFVSLRPMGGDTTPRHHWAYSEIDMSFTDQPCAGPGLVILILHDMKGQAPHFCWPPLVSIALARLAFRRGQRGASVPCTFGVSTVLKCSCEVVRAGAPPPCKNCT